MEADARSRSRAALAMLALVVLFALQLRLDAALNTEVNAPIRVDAADYASYAYNLVYHGVYSRERSWLQPGGAAPTPDAVRPPGYPMMIAPLVDGAPDRAFAMRVAVLQAVLGAAMVALAYLLGVALGGTLIGLAAAALTALSPHLVTSTHYVLTEVPFGVLATGVPFAAAAALRHDGGRAIAWWAVCGGLLGATMLFRGTLLYFAPVAAAAAFVLARSHRWRAALALLVGVAVVYGAWPMRIVAGGYDGGGTIALGSIHHGSFPRFMYEGRAETFGFPYDFDPDRATSTASAPALASSIATRVAADPVGMLRWYLLEKPVFLFGWEPIQGRGEVFVYPVMRSPYLEPGLASATLDLMRVLHWPLVALSFVACILGWRALSAGGDPARTGALRFAIVLYLFVIALHIVAAPFPRYSIPFRPLTYALAMVAIVETWRRLRLAATRFGPA